MQSSWKERKGLIIALVVAAAAAVVSMFIPAHISTGKLSWYEESKNEIANITLVAKTEDSAVFEVLATPENFHILASISLDDVAVGSRGCVGKTGGLVLDGSYEHDHDFLFTKKGNLFQALIGYYYPPYHGHIEGRVDYPAGS